MRQYNWIMVAVAAGWGSGFIGNHVSVASEEYSMVVGIVISEMGKPVSSARVVLTPGGYADTTDIAGHFTVDPVPAGKYTVTTSAPPTAGLTIDTRLITVLPGYPNQLRIVLERKTYTVDEIVVLSTPKNTDDERYRTPSFVSVVERSEFENTAATVADVIASTPSATITVMGGLGDYSEMSLRGSYASQVQVYLDGMLLNEAIGGAVNLAAIPLAQVESVEVWRSGAPSQFGGNAVGGVVNIRTRGMDSSRKTFSLGYGSFNTFSAGTVLNVRRGMSGFQLTGDYSSSDNDFRYKSTNGTMYNIDDDYWARRSNDEFRSANLLGKFRHVYPNGMLLELSEHVLSNSKNLPGRESARNSHSSLDTARNLFQGRLTAGPFFRNVLELQPTVQHGYVYEQYRDPDGAVSWGIQDNTYTTRTMTFLAPLTLTAGEHAAATLTPVFAGESFRPEYRLSKTVPLSCDRESFSFAADGTFKTFGERLLMTSSIRRDRYFSSYEGEPSPVNRTTPSSRFDYLTTVTTGIRCVVSEHVTFQGNYGDISRVPSLYELFGDRGGTLAKPGLRPERIFRWDTGGRVTLPLMRKLMSGTLEGAYFQNTYHDLIQWYANDAGFIQPDNVAGSYVKGSELVWNMRILNCLVCTGNWTFQRSKVTEETRKYYRGKQLPNRPRHYGSVKWGIPLRSLTFFWMIDSKSRYYLDRTNQAHKLYLGRTLHDAGISFSCLNGQAVCSLRAKNIGNVHTFDVQGMPKPGRSYMITVTYTVE